MDCILFSPLNIFFLITFYMYITYNIRLSEMLTTLLAELS